MHVSRNYPDRDLDEKSKEKKIKWRGWRIMASYVGKKGKGLKLQIKVGIHSRRKRGEKKRGEGGGRHNSIGPRTYYQSRRKKEKG